MKNPTLVIMAAGMGSRFGGLKQIEPVDDPFTVINADDFYGPSAFTAIYDYLANNSDDSQYAMVGYRVRNTVTENGSVARGVCEVENGLLTGVTERTW